MAAWAEHTSPENFTQCKPQLVSFSLKDRQRFLDNSWSA